jgi:hypothetical protein
VHGTRRQRSCGCVCSAPPPPARPCCCSCLEGQGQSISAHRPYHAGCVRPCDGRACTCSSPAVSARWHTGSLAAWVWCGVCCALCDPLTYRGRRPLGTGYLHLHGYRRPSRLRHYRRRWSQCRLTAVRKSLGIHSTLQTVNLSFVFLCVLLLQQIALQGARSGLSQA